MKYKTIPLSLYPVTGNRGVTPGLRKLGFTQRFCISDSKTLGIGSEWSLVKLAGQGIAIARNMYGVVIGVRHCVFKRQAYKKLTVLEYAEGSKRGRLLAEWYFREGRGVS